MMKFPDEDEISAELQAELSNYFNLANSLYEFWLMVQRDPHLEVSKLPAVVINTAMFLNMQLCRQFRSVVEECSRCEATCGSMISRGMYETILALLFVLKPRFYMVVEPEIAHGVHKTTTAGDLKYKTRLPSKGATSIHREHLSRELRAQLYVAHYMLAPEKMTNRFLGMPGYKRIAKARQKSAEPLLINDIKLTLGPKWFYIIKTSMHYFGLRSVSGLAEALGLNDWYKSVYSDQSGMVHGARALDFCQESADGEELLCSPFSSVIQVRQAMLSAVAMFLTGIFVMQKFIGFGEEVKTALDEFKTELNQLD